MSAVSHGRVVEYYSLILRGSKSTDPTDVSFNTIVESTVQDLNGCPQRRYMSRGPFDSETSNTFSFAE